jgi:hypothetical protein
METLATHDRPRVAAAEERETQTRRHTLADKRFSRRGNFVTGGVRSPKAPRAGAGNSPNGGMIQTGVVKESDPKSAIAHYI